jgi:hypothetical protein
LLIAAIRYNPRQPLGPQFGEQVEPRLHLIAISQARPIAMHIARGEACREIAFANAGRDGLGGRKLDLAAGPVGASRMGLEIACIIERLRRGCLSDGPRAAIGEMAY